MNNRTLHAAALTATAWMLTAAVAAADPQPAPTPPPDTPRCLTYSGQPWPHPRYLPCGWDWDGTHWTQTTAAITPTNLAELLAAP